MARWSFLGLAVLIGCVAVWVWLENRTSRDSRSPDKEPPELRLVNRLMELKNAGDPAADELLAPAPKVPEQPVSEEEAEHIQADCFLHQDIRFLSVRAAPANRFVLATKGNVSAPTLAVRTAKGVDRIQRTMSNPDLIVEVRDGKVHGIRAEMPSAR